MTVVRLIDKENKLQQYKEDLQQAKVAVVADYRGLTVSQLFELRKSLFKQKAKFSVVKNTLIKRAIKDSNKESLSSLFQGPSAVMFGFEDEVLPTKTLKEFLQKAKIGEIQGGFVEGQALSKEEILALAELPSIDELRAKLLGAINGPLAGLVMSLSGPQRGLVNVLDQYAKQKESS